MCKRERAVNILRLPTFNLSPYVRPRKTSVLVVNTKPHSTLQLHQNLGRFVGPFEAQVKYTLQGRIWLRSVFSEAKCAVCIPGPGILTYEQYIVSNGKMDRKR